MANLVVPPLSTHNFFNDVFVWICSRRSLFNIYCFFTAGCFFSDIRSRNAAQNFWSIPFCTLHEAYFMTMSCINDAKLVKVSRIWRTLGLSSMKNFFQVHPRYLWLLLLLISEQILVRWEHDQTRRRKEKRLNNFMHWIWMHYLSAILSIWYQCVCFASFLFRCILLHDSRCWYLRIWA